MGSFYASWLEKLKQWAGTASYEPNILFSVGGEIVPPPPLEVASLAVVVAATTDLASDVKMKQYRTELRTFLSQSPASPLNQPAAEMWHMKDIFQLWCEMAVFNDLSQLQTEFKALVMQGMLTFGRDAAVVFGFLLQGRARYGWGRANQAEETQWMVITALKALAQAETYLWSEHCGDLTLSQLVQTLP
jgi:hypothetical protein